MHRRIKLGMVGGGRGAFIGAVHRMAARLDDRFDLVAGAMFSDPDRAAASAADAAALTDDGVSGHRFIETVFKIHHSNGAWVRL